LNEQMPCQVGRIWGCEDLILTYRRGHLLGEETTAS